MNEVNFLGFKDLFFWIRGIFYFRSQGNIFLGSKEKFYHRQPGFSSHLTAKYFSLLFTLERLYSDQKIMSKKCS